MSINDDNDLGGFMQVRYADLNSGKNSSRDFVIRRRTPTIAQLFVVFLSVLLISISLTLSVHDRVNMLLMISALIVIAGWYVITVVQRNRDLVLTTEFQNALFASALGINNKFCVIIRKDGNIIYLDRSFQDMFPDFLRQPKRTIDVLFELGKVSKEEGNKVLSAIEQGVYSKVLFDIRGVGNEYHKIVMSIEPIMRPSGYIMLRGRDFVEARTTEELGNNTTSINKSSITLFSHVMDSMNMGVYMTNPSGELVYVNPVLEQWLGYQDGELGRHNLSLQDIIHQPGNRNDRIQPGNFEGEVYLRQKTGGVTKSFVNQKIIRDEQGKMMGCTALVHHFSDASSEIKKKLW